MILADTSVWIRHFRSPDPTLTERIANEEVWIHPFVIGELACGQLPERAGVLRFLRQLPTVPMATTAEVLELLERNHFFGRGIGWIDAHLIASSRLARCPLWTYDRRLDVLAQSLPPVRYG